MYSIKRFSKDGYNTHLEQVALQKDEYRIKALNRANLAGNAAAELTANTLYNTPGGHYKSKKGKRELEKISEKVGDMAHKYTYEKTLRKDGARRSMRTLGISSLMALSGKKTKDTRGKFKVKPGSIKVDKNTVTIKTELRR